MLMNKFPTTGFLREKNLRQFVPISSTTLWTWVKEGRFPEPIKLSTKTTVWKSEDVLSWIKKQGR